MDELLKEASENILALMATVAKLKAVLRETKPYVEKEQFILEKQFEGNTYMLSKYSQHSDLLKKINEVLE